MTPPETHDTEEVASMNGDPFSTAMSALANPSPLDVARQDLARRVQALDDSPRWQERAILSSLATVADMVCRIGDHDHSTHYRADKSGDLVTAALRVELESLRAYAETDDRFEDAADRQLNAAAEVLESVAGAVRLVLWTVARQSNGQGAEMYRSDADQIRSAVAALDRWAKSVCAGAVPDPVDE